MIKSKTEILVRNRNNGNLTKIKLNGDPLEQMNEYNYLGNIR